MIPSSSSSERVPGNLISFKLYGSAHFSGLPSQGPLLLLVLFAIELLHVVLIIRADDKF